MKLLQGQRVLPRETKREREILKIQKRTEARTGRPELWGGFRDRKRSRVLQTGSGRERDVDWAWDKETREANWTERKSSGLNLLWFGIGTGTGFSFNQPLGDWQIQQHDLEILQVPKFCLLGIGPFFFCFFWRSSFLYFSN